MKQDIPIPQQLVFDKISSSKLRSLILPPLQPDEIRVKTIYSGVSTGTELLVYRGLIDQNLAEDDTLEQRFTYPFAYGYANVGRIVATGSTEYSSLIGKTLFSFSPHQEYSTISANSHLLIVPDDIPNQRAIFFANLETAIALVQDATPLIGERVAVIGAGIVGQLLARVLSQFPGIDLHVVDPNPDRRNQLSQLDCRVYGTISELPNNFDIMFEITGRSNLVNALFPHCTNDSRIIIGSWYGDHNNQIRLDTGFHRKRIRLISSQVSHINRDLMGRISKEQRYESVWKILKKLSLEELISHCVPFTKAPSTFQALAKNPHEFLQVCFDYSGGSDVSSGY